MVVVTLLISRPACNNNVFAASMVPSTLLIFSNASIAILFALIRPLMLSTVLASMRKAWRPATVPLLLRFSLIFSSLTRPDNKAPLPLISPGNTRTYTCGTNTCALDPSSKLTVCSTIHTISLVKRAICSALKATPGVKFKSWAALIPLSIKALNCSSSLSYPSK